jgi:hypothetical protein
MKHNGASLITMNRFWSQYQDSLVAALQQAEVTLARGEVVGQEQALELLCEWTTADRNQKGTVHLVGNGASGAWPAIWRWIG